MHNTNSKEIYSVWPQFYRCEFFKYNVEEKEEECNEEDEDEEEDKDSNTITKQLYQCTRPSGLLYSDAGVVVSNTVCSGLKYK